MARNSDKHYNDFGGLDVRSNKLMQNPKFARGGTNFRFNYADELQKMNGFQKKMPVTGAENGIFEYKFRDIDTGESKTEVLGVDSAGNLNRRRFHFLSLTKSGGTVTAYSLFYDEVAVSWRILLYDMANAIVGAVSFPETDTLLQLSTKINALTLTGLASSVVDINGNVVASTTCLAYTLNTVIMEAVATGDTLNPAWYWEQVVFPDSSTVPFPLVVSEVDNPNYEGITWINLNNAIYITDGSWLMKYDGFQVSRAGMPKVAGQYGNLANYNASGFSTIETATGSVSAWTAGSHRIRFQFCYTDPNGAAIFGKVQGNDPTVMGEGFNVANPDGTFPYVNFFVPSIAQDHTFPVYACEIDGDQTLLAVPTPQTLTIQAGHNLQVGQALRADEIFGATGMSGVGEESLYYLEITAVTATTVTVTGYPNTVSPLDLANGQVLNSCYMPSNYMGRSNCRYDSFLPVYGAYIRVLVAKANEVDIYYQLDGYLPVPLDSSQEYTRTIGAPDSLIEEGPLFDDEDPEQAGADLARASRYISKWQDTLVQAGRTYTPALVQAYYPSIYDPALVLSTNANAIVAENLVTYTESYLCDFQSIYWADSAVAEGFPQDGLHEFAIDTPFNDEMRGMSPNKDSFFAFKNRSTGYLTGSLAENSLQLEIMESDAGAACHKAIQNVEGAVFYMDENTGFWSVIAGRLPEFIGYGIQTYFKNNTLGLNFRKAWAANFHAQDQYICFIPGSVQDQIFTLDYAVTATGARSAWYPWSGINAAAGVLATADDELLVSSKGTATTWLQKFTGTKYDYSIHTSPVLFEYIGSWINFALPTIDKKFVKVWVNSIQGGFDLMITQFANYLSPSIGEIAINFPLESDSKLTVKNWMDVNVDKLSAISIGFENDWIYEDVRIQGWEIEYAPGFDTAEARK